MAVGLAGRYRAEEVTGQERERLYALANDIHSGYEVYEQRAVGIGTCRCYSWP